MDIISNKKYNIIYADPAWTFKTYSDKGKGRSAEKHYSCMSIDDIYNLPVQEISKDDCICFLWVTYPLLNEGIKRMEEWGFTYKTCGFSWININKKTHFNVPHNHPCCIFSGVFYIKTPYNSGNFAFYRNIHVYKSTELIKPEENMLILFPSHFDHYVEPNNSNQDRISISFNYSQNYEPQS